MASPSGVNGARAASRAAACPCPPMPPLPASHRPVRSRTGGGPLGGSASNASLLIPGKLHACANPADGHANPAATTNAVNHFCIPCVLLLEFTYVAENHGLRLTVVCSIRRDAPPLRRSPHR